MDVNIEIAASAVLPEVYKITGYTGKKAVQDKDMDRISSTVDDGGILQGYFVEACNALGDVVSRFGYASSLSTSSVTYALTLPANWKTGVQTSMTNAMKLYLVNAICRQWFNLSQKGEVAYYEGQMTICADSIRKYLCERAKPTLN